MNMAYNKLGRDRIPESIHESGKRAEFETLNDEDFRCALLDKLVEEAPEAQNAKRKS